MTNRTASLRMLRTANPLLPPGFIPGSVMGTPPSVSMSAANTNSLSAGRYWPCITAQNGVGPNTNPYGSFTYFGAARPVQQTTYSGCVFFTSVSFGGVTNHGGGANGRKFNHAVIAFYHYGTQFNIAMVGNATQATFCLKVDDQYNTLTPVNVPTGANFYYYNVTFATAKWRRIEIVVNQFFLFNGVWTGLSDSIMPAPVRGPRVVFVGDSLIEGFGASNGGASSFCQRTFELLGWSNYLSSGVGGTGLLATSGGATNYRNRFNTDLVPFAPDIVIVQGSTNDSAGAFTATAMGDEVTAIIQTIRTLFPNCLVFVTSQVAVNGPTGMTNLTWLHRAAMKAATITAGGHWIDLLERPLPQDFTPSSHTLTTSPGVGVSVFSVSGTVPPAIGGVYEMLDKTRVLVKAVANTSPPYSVTIESGGLQTAQTAGNTMVQVGHCPWSGTGRVGATTGDGNSDVLVSNDHVHPTQIGHDMIAQIMCEEIQAAIQTA